jgi:L-alanine-DL-glutamate epimerase-like enolase superfamily enzyme
MFAISGVEIALWDLLGRILDTPVWRLLEGQARRRLPAYTSLLRYDVPSDVATVCRRSLALGFRKLKLHQTDVASVRAARKAVGPDVELMLDVNCAWNPDEAIAMARELVPHHLSWLEEPVWPPEDYEGLRRVSEAAGTPIALGENESTLFGFREIITHRAGAILQPSVIKVGGISEMMKIAAMANRANLAIAPHSFYFGPGLAATLHVAASLTKEVAIELPACELEVPFLNDPIVARDGWVEVPDGPGLGVTVNDDAVRRYPYSPDAAQPFVIGAR